MIDEKFHELKELSGHDIEEEKKLLSLSVYNYFFHLESISKSTQKRNDIQSQAAQGNRKSKWV